MGNIGNEKNENKNETIKKVVNKENKHNEKKKYMKKKAFSITKKDQNNSFRWSWGNRKEHDSF